MFLVVVKIDVFFIQREFHNEQIGILSCATNLNPFLYPRSRQYFTGQIKRSINRIRCSRVRCDFQPPTICGSYVSSENISNLRLAVQTGKEDLHSLKGSVFVREVPQLTGVLPGGYTTENRVRKMVSRQNDPRGDG